MPPSQRSILVPSASAPGARGAQLVRADTPDHVRAASTSLANTNSLRRCAGHLRECRSALRGRPRLAMTFAIAVVRNSRLRATRFVADRSRAQPVPGSESHRRGAARGRHCCATFPRNPIVRFDGRADERSRAAAGRGDRIATDRAAAAGYSFVGMRSCVIGDRGPGDRARRRSRVGGWAPSRPGGQAIAPCVSSSQAPLALARQERSLALVASHECSPSVAITPRSAAR